MPVYNKRGILLLPKVIVLNPKDGGMGQRTPEEMPKILAACDRAAAGPTAPAKGLMLAGMEYQD